jgi:steroid delta-isomerase-like uncharacterized protein
LSSADSGRPTLRWESRGTHFSAGLDAHHPRFRPADDFVEHETGPGLESTKAGTKQLFAMMKAGFPDLRFDAEDILESGDKVVARSRVTGTNKGEFMGIPASGKSIDIQAIDILRFGADGLAHEHWGVMDTMSMMQQIGAVPQGPPA